MSLLAGFKTSKYSSVCNYESLFASFSTKIDKVLLTAMKQLDSIGTRSVFSLCYGFAMENILALTKENVLHGDKHSFGISWQESGFLLMFDLRLSS